jgi:hypothetical protein
MGLLVPIKQKLSYVKTTVYLVSQKVAVKSTLFLGSRKVQQIIGTQQSHQNTAEL